MKLLIIEDDEVLRGVVEARLTTVGHTVVTAPDGQAGLRLAYQHRPDLIVLDVMMDTTTAGFQFALTLHSPEADSEYSEFTKTPIIMLTAIHSTTPLRFSPDDDYLPVQTFLEKPVDTKVLLATIHRHLGE